ncbi:MAG: helix-turn-helix domain-containing protein [Stellaceae bacterium]
MACDPATGNLLTRIADAGGSGHFNATQRFAYNGFGQVVTATNPLDRAADTLWRRVPEQAGETMTPGAFRHWRERKASTLDQAAHALGLSRRMVAYYEQGNRPIPRVVALATRALDMELQ